MRYILSENRNILSLFKRTPDFDKWVRAVFGVGGGNSLHRIPKVTGGFLLPFSETPPLLLAQLYEPALTTFPSPESNLYIPDSELSPCK